MRRYFSLFILAVCFLAGCKEKKKSERRLVYNEDFKWTISIPAGFDTLSKDKWSVMQGRGEKVLEETHGVEIENNAKTIFVFQSDQFNYFESNHQPFDSTEDGDFSESFHALNDMLYSTFESQMPKAKLDSSSSVQTISGLQFNVFKVRIEISAKMVLNWQMFSRLFGKEEFTVNIMTADKEKERELLDSWLNSKFDKPLPSK